MKSRQVAGNAARMFLACAAMSAPAFSQSATVINVGKPIHAAVGTLVEDFRLGKGSDAAEYSFSYPFLFAARDGGMFVVDIQDPGGVGNFNSAVHRYDRNGIYVRSYGRDGDGPGEYRGGVGHATELPDGRVLVSDRKGILVYSATGKFIERWEAKSWSYSYGEMVHVNPRGVVDVRSSYAARDTSGREKWTIREFTFAGKPVDKVVLSSDAIFPSPPKAGAIPLPFNPKSLLEWSPLGYWVTANSAAYAVDIHFPGANQSASSATKSSGARVVSIRRSVPAVVVQSGERAAWRDTILAKNRRRKDTPNWSWAGPDLPSTKPLLEHVNVAQDGRLWVQVTQPAQRRTTPVSMPPWKWNTPAGIWFAPIMMDVLQPDGTYVGRVHFPDALYEPPFARTDAAFLATGDTIWMTTLSDDGEVFVKRYHVVWN